MPTTGTYGSVTLGKEFACAMRFDDSFFNPDLTLKVRTCNYLEAALATITPVCWGEDYYGPNQASWNRDVGEAMSMVTTWDPIVQVQSCHQQDGSNLSYFSR